MRAQLIGRADVGLSVRDAEVVAYLDGRSRGFGPADYSDPLLRRYP